jgi:hypothetical protein
MIKFYFGYSPNIPMHRITNKAVIPVKTGIQNILKSQFLWAPAFAGATNQSNRCLRHFAY